MSLDLGLFEEDVGSRRAVVFRVWQHLDLTTRESHGSVLHTLGIQVWHNLGLTWRFMGLRLFITGVITLLTTGVTPFRPFGGVYK